MWNCKITVVEVIAYSYAVIHYRSAMEGRNIKLAVVLIQRSSVFINSGTEDTVSTEKASELCTTCDLNPKLLLLLHHNEHLQGYIVR